MPSKLQSSLVASFYEHCVARIEPHGVFPAPAAMRDHSGRVRLLSLDLSPGEIMDLMADASTGPHVAELIFAIDRYAKPGQGVDTADLLTVFHWSPVLGWRMAVVEYRINPPTAKPYDWSNPYWLDLCQDDLVRLTQLTEAGRLVGAD